MKSFTLAEDSARARATEHYQAIRGAATHACHRDMKFIVPKNRAIKIDARDTRRASIALARVLLDEISSL